MIGESWFRDPHELHRHNTDHKSKKIVPAVLLGAALVLVVGCGVAQDQSAGQPDVPVASPDTYAGKPTNPGDISAGYRYIFRMTSPGNDHFAITERAIYLWFWPDTSRVIFRLENRLGNQMKILWDECRFITTEGIAYRTIHEGVTYDRRNLPQAYTLVPGLGRYNDWLAPVELLESPEAAAGGPMRLLFPTDVQAMSYAGKEFSVVFVVEIEGTARRWNLVFTIDTVSPPE